MKEKDTSISPGDKPLFLIDLKFLGIALLVALAFRFYNISSLELQHMDESIYVSSSLKALTLLNSDPHAVSEIISTDCFSLYFAPPLYYMLTTLTFLLLGPSATAAFLVSAFFGALAVPFAMLLGSEIFGKRAGIIAGTLLCVCEYHLLYSRMALTDATATTFIIAAVWSGVAARRTGRKSILVLAATLSFFAVLAKFNGVLIPILFAIGMACESFIGKKSGTEKQDKKSEKSKAGKPAFGSLMPIVFISVGTGLAALLVAWLISAGPGWNSFLAHRAHHTSHDLLLSGYEGVREYGSSLLLWVPWVVLLFGIWGVIRTCRHRKAPEIFLLAILLAYAASTLSYHKYPRLLLPFVVILLIFSASAAEDVWQKLNNWIKLRNAVTALMALLILLPVRHALVQPAYVHLRATEEAGKQAARLGSPLVLADFSPVMFYAFTTRRNPPPVIRLQPTQIIAMQREGKPFILLLDRSTSMHSKKLLKNKTDEITGTYNEVEATNRMGAYEVLRNRLTNLYGPDPSLSNWEQDAKIEIYEVNAN